MFWHYQLVCKYSCMCLLEHNAGGCHGIFLELKLFECKTSTSSTLQNHAKLFFKVGALVTLLLFTRL